MFWIADSVISDYILSQVGFNSSDFKPLDDTLFKEYLGDPYVRLTTYNSYQTLPFVKHNKKIITRKSFNERDVYTQLKNQVESGLLHTKQESDVCILCKQDILSYLSQNLDDYYKSHFAVNQTYRGYNTDLCSRKLGLFLMIRTNLCNAKHKDKLKQLYDSKHNINLCVITCYKEFEDEDRGFIYIPSHVNENNKIKVLNGVFEKVTKYFNSFLYKNSNSITTERMIKMEGLLVFDMGELKEYTEGLCRKCGCRLLPSDGTTLEVEFSGDFQTNVSLFLNNFKANKEYSNLSWLTDQVESCGCIYLSVPEQDYNLVLEGQKVLSSSLHIPSVKKEVLIKDLKRAVIKVCKEMGITDKKEISNSVKLSALDTLVKLEVHCTDSYVAEMFKSLWIDFFISIPTEYWEYGYFCFINMFDEKLHIVNNEVLLVGYIQLNK